jgi:hypothetical protein
MSTHQPPVSTDLNIDSTIEKVKEELYLDLSVVLKRIIQILNFLVILQHIVTLYLIHYFVKETFTHNEYLLKIIHVILGHIWFGICCFLILCLICVLPIKLFSYISLLFLLILIIVYASMISTMQSNLEKDPIDIYVKNMSLFSLTFCFFIIFQTLMLPWFLNHHYSKCKIQK